MQLKKALISASAPAKVNLTLQVLGRRRDGYHLLDSLVAFADVGERVSVRHSDAVELSISGAMAGDIQAHNNLVLSADAAVRRISPALPKLHYELKKCIPIAAGLGGGSADAAAVLRILSAMGYGPKSQEDLVSLALGLGADVPVCIDCVPARMSGVGENIRRFSNWPEVFCILVNPRIPVSTKEVFGALNLGPGEMVNQSEFMPLTDDRHDLEQMIIDGRNDLEDAACKLVPGIASILSTIGLTRGCLAARLSGSGASCFGLYRNLCEAEVAGADLAAAHPDWWIRSALIGRCNSEPISVSG